MNNGTLRALPGGLVELFVDPRAVGLNVQWVVLLIALYEHKHMGSDVEVWLGLYNLLRRAAL
jgi:hypothetical protein